MAIIPLRVIEWHYDDSTNRVVATLVGLPADPLADPDPNDKGPLTTLRVEFQPHVVESEERPPIEIAPPEEASNGEEGPSTL